MSNQPKYCVGKPRPWFDQFCINWIWGGNDKLTRAAKKSPPKRWFLCS